MLHKLEGPKLEDPLNRIHDVRLSMHSSKPASGFYGGIRVSDASTGDSRVCLRTAKVFHMISVIIMTWHDTTQR